MPLLSMLYAARVPIIVAALTVVLMVVPSQARDMMDYLQENGPGSIPFEFSLLLLAGFAWYWARALLNARFEVPYPCRDRVVCEASFRRELEILWTVSAVTENQQQLMKERLGSDSRMAARIFVWLPRALFLWILIGGMLAAGPFSTGNGAFILAIFALALFGWIFRKKTGDFCSIVVRERFGRPGIENRQKPRIFVLDLYTPTLSELWNYAPWYTDFDYQPSLPFVRQFRLSRTLPFCLCCMISLLPFVLFIVEAVVPVGSNNYAVALGKALPGPTTGIFLFATLLGLFSLLVALGSSWAIPLWKGVAALLPDHFGGRVPLPLGPLILLYAFFASKYFPLHDVRPAGWLQPQADWGSFAIACVIVFVGVSVVFFKSRTALHHWWLGSAGLVFLALMLLLPNVWKATAGSAAISFGQSDQRHDERLLLGKFLEDWIKTCGPRKLDPFAILQPVIVALSGGASRAGLWSARALWSIDQQLRPEKGEHWWKPPWKPWNPLTSIFAISSVSGGSLGAAEYMALRRGLARASPNGWAKCHLFWAGNARQFQSRRKRADFLRVTRRIMIDATSQDALGPDLAGFYRDFVRSMIAPVAWITGQYGSGVRALFEHDPGQENPAALTNRVLLRDRAAALEVAFAQNWERALKSNRSLTELGFEPYHFSQSYLSLNYAPGPSGSSLTVIHGMPIWIGNGSDLQNGTPVLTVPFRPDKDHLVRTWPFPGARDALGLLKRDIRISTAITNTARYPLISPVGEMAATNRAKPGDPEYGLRPTQIGDGGYFDNSGLLAARELAEWLRGIPGRCAREKAGDTTLLGKVCRRLNGAQIAPIIVAVTADSDPVVTAAKVERCGSGPDRNPEHPAGFQKQDQISEEAFGLNAVRSGHTQVLLFQLGIEFCNAPENDEGFRKPHFFQLYLHANGGAGVPMNWLISEPTAHFIWSDMDAEDNRRELFRLHRRALGLDDPPNEGTPSPQQEDGPASPTLQQALVR